MTIKRVNSTGRRKIPKNRIEIETFGEGASRTFNASFDLSEFAFPQNAAVVLDVFCPGTSDFQRIECGTISAITEPRSCLLDKCKAERAFFTLKVIDQTEKVGRVLGLAERVYPKNQDVNPRKNRGLLPIQTSNELGAQLWKLDFTSGDVFLLVNGSIPNFASRFSSPSYAALLFPSILREILSRAIREKTDEDEEENWTKRWISFGILCRQSEVDDQNKSRLPSIPDAEDAEDWIDEAIEGFCRQHQLMENFLKLYSPGEID